jgi:anti-sigma regulatory factor (Ser/Thr protein kinase)
LAGRCSPDALETITLLVTELVTNAILHAGTPLQLTVEARPGAVRICVEDHTRALPERQDLEPDAITGRGLALVEQLSSAWGVEATQSGKGVWCEVPI